MMSLTMCSNLLFEYQKYSENDVSMVLKVIIIKFGKDAGVLGRYTRDF